MRAVRGNQADAAVGVSEGDQVFAEQAHAHWVAIRLGQLGGQQSRHPVAAHDVAHRRARADSSDQVVVFTLQHAYTRSPDVGLNIRLSRSYGYGTVFPDWSPAFMP